MKGREQYFAHMVEHMAATMAMVPAVLRKPLDGSVAMTSNLLAAANQDLEPVLNPECDGPTPRDLSRPVRIGAIADLSDHTGYAAFHFETARKEELRGAGRLPFLSPYPHLHMSLAVMPPYERTREWTRAFIGWHPREKVWVRWGQNFPRPKFDPMIHERASMLISLQFSRRYNWRVLVGATEHAPRLAIDCQPESARKLFGARDIPPGRKRRAALRHWVTEHFRNVQAEVPTAVRSHFRGAETFDWAGLHCEIEPSEHDKDRIGGYPTHVRGSR